MRAARARGFSAARARVPIFILESFKLKARIAHNQAAVLNQSRNTTYYNIVYFQKYVLTSKQYDSCEDRGFFFELNRTLRARARRAQ